MLQSFMIPDVPLIPQDKGMACWYASAQMLIQWRRNRRQMTEAAFADPGELPDLVQKYMANNGLQWRDMVRFAKEIGLKPVPPMTPTEDAILAWLRNYGPIWAAGQKVTPTNRYGHVFVITGISSSLIYINDPEPVNIGARISKDLGWLTTLLEWGSDPVIATNFLHFP